MSAERRSQGGPSQLAAPSESDFIAPDISTYSGTGLRVYVKQ